MAATTSTATAATSKRRSLLRTTKCVRFRRQAQRLRRQPLRERCLQRARLLKKQRFFIHFQDVIDDARFNLRLLERAAGKALLKSCGGKIIIDLSRMSVQKVRNMLYDHVPPRLRILNCGFHYWLKTPAVSKAHRRHQARTAFLAEPPKPARVTSRPQGRAPPDPESCGKGQSKGQTKHRRRPAPWQKKSAPTTPDPPAPAAKAATPLKFSSGARPSRRGAPWHRAQRGPTQPTVPPPSWLLSGSSGGATPASSSTSLLRRKAKLATVRRSMVDVVEDEDM